MLTQYDFLEQVTKIVHPNVFFSQRNCSFHLHLVFAEAWHWLLPISIAGTGATNRPNFHLSDFHHWNNCRPLPESPLLSVFLVAKYFLDFLCLVFLTLREFSSGFVWICTADTRTHEIFHFKCFDSIAKTITEEPSLPWHHQSYDLCRFCLLQYIMCTHHCKTITLIFHIWSVLVGRL